MKLAIFVFALIVAAISTRAADAPTPFPLLGLWRVVSAVDADGNSPEAPAEGEFEFRSDGVLLITGKDPAKGINKPMRLRFRYTFEPHCFTLPMYRMLAPVSTG